MYCGNIIEPGQPFVAAHVVDGDPTSGWDVAHGLCNERAKDRFRAVRANEADRMRC